MVNLEVLFYDLCMTGTGRDKRTKFVPVTDEKAKEWNFPNWKQVVPNCTENDNQIEFKGGSQTLELEIFKLQFAVASCGTDALISQPFIDLICKPRLTYKVHIGDGFTPLVFELPHFYSFVMMPCRSNLDKSVVNRILNDYKSKVIDECQKTNPQKTAQISQEPVTEPEVKPVAEPVPAPKTRRKAPKTAPKTKTRKPRPPAFSYHCELENGKHITLDSIKAVKARKDVVHCRIEPVRRSRKAA